MSWRIIYLNPFEDFHDQGGISELTIPVNTTVHWLHQGAGLYPRPEMDAKTLPQPEVYEGQKSAGGFYMSAVGSFALVSDPILVAPGSTVRGTVMYMHVFNTAPNIGGGSRLGIIDGDGPFVPGAGPEWPIGGTNPFHDSAIRWGEWLGTYGADALPDRDWAALYTPPVEVMGDFVRLVIQFNADVAAKGSHGHWDNLTLEKWDGGGVTPPPSDGGSFDSIRARLDVIEAQLTGIRGDLAAIEASAVRAIVIGPA